MPDDPVQIRRIAKAVGYPVIIKAAGGVRAWHAGGAHRSSPDQCRADDQGRGPVQPSTIRRSIWRSFPEPAPYRIQIMADKHKNAVYWVSAIAPCSAATRRSSRRPRHGHLPQADRENRRTLRGGLQEDRLPRRGHIRVPLRGRRVLFIEMNTRCAGGHPRHRTDHRGGHREDADHGGGRRKTAVHQRDIQIRGHALESV